MSFHWYLSRIGKSLQGNRIAQRASKHRQQPRLTFFRPRLEYLEDRTLLTSFGGFASGLSSDLSNLQANGIAVALNGVNQAPTVPFVSNQLGNVSGGAVFTTNVISKFTNAISSATDAPSLQNNIQSQLGSTLTPYVTVTQNSDTDKTVSVEVYLHETVVPSSTPLNFTLGLPGLSLAASTTGGVSISVGFDYDLAVTYDPVTNKISFDTSKTLNQQNEASLPSAAVGHEMALYVTANLPSTFSAQVTLGLLQGAIKDHVVNGKSQTNLNATFRLDGLDGNNLSSISMSPPSGSAKIDVDFTAGVQQNGTLINGFPSISATMNLNWTLGQAPSVEFDDVQMSVQGFFQTLAGPMLQNIHSVTGPLEPIVDALQEEPLKQIGVDMTYEQILEQVLGLSQEQMSFFDDVANLIRLVNAAHNAVNSATGTINLGSFTLNDPRGGTGGIASSNPNGNAMSDLQADAPDFFNALHAEDNTPSNGPPTGLYFNFLQDPSILFPLFVETPSSSTPPPTLITFTLPTLQFSISETKPLAVIPIPPFGPLLTLNAELQGGISLVGNLSMGYDAQGLIDFQKNPSKPSLLLDGFYVDTSKPLLTISGASSGSSGTKYFLSFIGSINVNLDLSTIAADAGVSLPDWFSQVADLAIPIKADASAILQTGLTGEIDVGLNGNKDSRFRLAEPSAGALFSASGEIDFGGDLEFKASASANIPTVTVHRNKYGIPDGISAGTKQVSVSYDKILYDFPTIPLFKFGNNGNSSTEVQQAQSNPILATLYNSQSQLSDGHQVSGGTLVLNIGPYANNRAVSPNDSNANYVIHHVSGSATDPSGETVSVQAYGMTEQFSGVTAIYADTGSDNDSILLDDGVLSPSYLLAGSGTDTLKAGSGATTLVGGSGADTLIAGPAAGVNNTIVTSTGNTTIVGSAGDDSIIIVGSGTNNITGGSGNDTVIEAGNSNFSLIADSSSNAQLTGDATSTLNQIKSVQLSGSSNAQTFSVQNWGGSVSLAGSGTGDQFNIVLAGSGSASCTVQDSADDGTLQVTGSQYGDDFTLKAGSVTDHAEQVTFSGIDQLIVQAGVDQQEQSTFDILGTGAGTTTIVNGGASANQFNVQSVSGSTTINTISGEDTIDVGSNAPALNGILSGIQGALTIHGSNGQDAANVDDSGASTSQRSGKLTSTTLTGLGMGPSGITFSGLTAFNLNVGPGALTSDTFDITDVDVPSLVTGPTYALFNQNPVGKLSVTYDIGSVRVYTGMPGSFAGPIATVTLFEGYSPWLLREIIDPPASNNGANGGTPSQDPTSPNSGDAGDPQAPVIPPVTTSGDDPAPTDPPTTTSPPDTNQQGNTNPDPTTPPGNPTPPGNTATTPVNTPSLPTIGANPILGNTPITIGAIPSSANGSPATNSASSPASDPVLPPWLTLFELEMKTLQTEVEALESLWFQLLSNFETLLSH